MQRLDGLDECDREALHASPIISLLLCGRDKPSRGPGRREIGHGALAGEALIPVLPSVEEFPAIAVSRPSSPTGSTSMASPVPLHGSDGCSVPHREDGCRYFLRTGYRGRPIIDTIWY